MSGAGCRPPPDADHVLILANPTAGRGAAGGRVASLVESLKRRGLHVESFCDLAEGCQRANEIHGTGALRALVGVGGDGTIAELVNRTDSGVPICVCAAGTSNLLARCLRLPAGTGPICEAIVHGRRLTIDAASANGRVFLLMAGCGLDAHVVAEVHRRRHPTTAGRFSYWSYAKPIFHAIRSYQYPEIRVHWEDAVEGPCCNGVQDPLVVRWAFALNLPLYGWGLPLAYWTDPTDGLLDVCTFQYGSLWHGLRYAMAAQCRWHRRLADCRVVRAARVRITAEQPVPYQLDGDPGGYLPLEIGVLPDRFTFLAPEGHCWRA